MQSKRKSFSRFTNFLESETKKKMQKGQFGAGEYARQEETKTKYKMKEPDGIRN